MHKRQKLKLFVAVILTLVPLSGFGADIHDDAGTTGAAFLKIEPGSRPVGMGSAFVGLANDINTIYWNPAGLTAVRERQLTAMQNFSFADINNEFIGYAQPFGAQGTWGLSFLGAFTEIERRRGPTEEPDSTVTVGGFAVGASYAHALSPGLSIGGTAKMISQQLDVEDSIGAAVDVGVLFRMLKDQLGVGVSAQNLGFLDTDEDLPLNVRGGVAYQVRTKPNLADPTSPRDLFVLVADVSWPILSGFPTVHVGVENWFYDVLAVRAGYSLSKGENPANGLTAGIGLRRKGEASLENVNFQFDYAFVPDQDVGDAHRISLIMRF